MSIYRISEFHLGAPLCRLSRRPWLWLAVTMAIIMIIIHNAICVLVSISAYRSSRCWIHRFDRDMPTHAMGALLRCLGRTNQTPSSILILFSRVPLSKCLKAFDVPWGVQRLRRSPCSTKHTRLGMPGPEIDSLAGESFPCLPNWDFRTEHQSTKFRI